MTDLAIIQLIGWLYVVFGIGILANTTLYKKILEAYMQSRPVLMSVGVSLFVLGFVMVNVHNTWEISWQNTVVTLIGWVILLKGAMFILAPKLTSWMTQQFNFTKHMGVWGMIISVAGIAFLLLGYLS